MDAQHERDYDDRDGTTVAPIPWKKPSMVESIASGSSDSPLMVTTTEDTTISPSNYTDEMGRSPELIPWVPISPFLSEVIGLPKRGENIKSESLLRSATQFQRMIADPSPTGTRVLTGASDEISSFPVTPKLELNGYFKGSSYQIRPTHRLKQRLRHLVEGLVVIIRSLSSSNQEQKIQFIKPSRRTRSKARRFLTLLLTLGGFLALVNWAARLFRAQISHHEDAQSFINASPWLTSPTYNRIRPETPAVTDHERISDTQPHPIEKLINEANKSWNEKVDRQSTTLAAAINEYRNRYQMEPPAGFDRWFQYAQTQNHVLVDEYDSLMHQLTPYRNLTLSQLRSRTNQLGSQRGFGLVNIRGGNVKVQLKKLPPRLLYTNLDHQNAHFELEEEKSRQNALKSEDEEAWYEEESKDRTKTQSWAFGQLMSKIAKLEPQLKDMSFAVNEASEPRVVLPWRTEAVDEMSSSTSKEILADWEDSISSEYELSDVWDEFKKSCPPQSEARRLFITLASKQIDPRNQTPRQLLKRKASILEPSTKAINGVFMRDLRSSDSSHYGSLAIKPRSLNLNDDVHHFEFANHSLTHIQDLYCTYPKRRVEQGLFFSDTRKLAGLFPVFSATSAQGFGDIVIPSYLYTQDPYRTRHYVHEPVGRDFDGEFEGGGQMTSEDHKSWKNWTVDWSLRSNKVHWRGLPVDGGNNPPGNQPTFNRHRTVKKFGTWISHESQRVVWLVRPIHPVLHRLMRLFTNKGSAPVPVRMGKVLDQAALNKEIMDVGFTSDRGCGVEKACEELVKGGYRFSMWQPFAAIKHFKMALDIDGIGHSARFLDIMRSGTAVVKNTIYREYHTDWLMPWVHYIPLSTESHELYNIWTYFLGSESVLTKLLGKTNMRSETWSRKLVSMGSEVTNKEAQLKEIAEGGMRWSSSIGREVDWEIYCYRLALEWNRIWNEDNDYFTQDEVKITTA